MKKELQDKLFSKYPEIFRERKLPMSKTCMCWGIDTGDGWYDLIENLCKNIEEIKEEFPNIDIIATQVKEKFGGLRFYYRTEIKNNIDRDNLNDEYKEMEDKLDKAVEKAEQKSYKTCEVCGSTKNVSQTKGWISTLCDKCMDKRRRKYESENKEK
jgi:RNA polymerase-binding transcription factor DksA